jgi:hypothetical protein
MDKRQTYLRIDSRVVFYYKKKPDNVNNLSNYLTDVVFDVYDYLKLLPRFDFLFYKKRNQLRVIARSYIHLRCKCI